MTRDEVRAWALRELHPDQSPAAGLGALAVLDGTFDESRCGPSGSVWESSFCEGAREAILRLAEPEPVGRIAHGQSVGG